MRAYFDAEVAALRSELAQAYALMERLRTLPLPNMSEARRIRSTSFTYAV
jgi:hypothetical protein